MDQPSKCYHSLHNSSDTAFQSAMSTKSNQRLHDHSSQYLLSKINTASSFNSTASTFIASNELITRPTNVNSSLPCGYSMSSSHSREANMLTSGHHITPDANPASNSKKKKKKSRKNEKSKTSTASVSSSSIEGCQSNVSSIELGGSVALSQPHHHHHYQHHYVQQTESVIISTRKLSVVESVSCPLGQTGTYHPNVSSNGSSTCHQMSNCNINYHHSNPSIREGMSETLQTDNNYALSQSTTTISNLISHSSSGSSLNLHRHDELAKLNETESTSRTAPVYKSKHKKKKRKDDRKYFSSSSQVFPNKLYSSSTSVQSEVFDKNKRDLKKLKHFVPLSEGSRTSSSQTHSSSSSDTSQSDSEQGQSKVYDNYQRKQLKKNQLNCSFSSSSSSSANSSSSYSDSSSEDEVKSCTSGSSSSRPNSSSSKSSNLSTYKDVLNRISVKSTNDSLLSNIAQKNVTNTHKHTSDKATNSVNYRTQSSPTLDLAAGGNNENNANLKFSPSFRSSAFSVDTILHSEKATTNQEEGNGPSDKLSLGAPSQKDTLSLSKQLTPLSSVQSDDCNSIESPLSVESSGKESGKDESTKSAVKRRDPAEERQRLRSYRIAHHLSQSRSALSRSVASESNVNCTTKSTESVKPVTSSACSAIPTVTTTVVTCAAPTTTALVTSVASTSTKTVVEPSITLSDANRTATSVSAQSKKDRPSVKVSQSETPKSTTVKKPVAVVSSNSIKVNNQPVLAPSQQQNFLNPSFFVPGATSTFPYSQHYPFSPAFMPTLFQNQFLNNVATTTKGSSNVNANQTRFLHPTHTQSQLTIFTSPALGSNAATAHALSPFPFSGVSPISHPTLLSPTFPASALPAGGASNAPLLIPKSLNFSLANTMDHAHPLMMFSVPNSKTSTCTSSATSNTHHTPPFILPRIVSSNTKSSSATICSTVSSKSSNHSRSKSEASSSQSKQTIIKSSLILSNTTTSQTVATAAQNSPLSTILPPQTLLLLPQPISSPFPAGKNVLANSQTSSVGKSSVESCTSLAPITCKTTSIDSNLTKGPLSRVATVQQPIMPATSIRPSTLANSFIFSPNSTHSQMPYTLFSPSHPLMQPISIQAPPPPPPSSFLGTQLLLSVISPTNRNPLATPLGQGLKASTSSNATLTNVITTTPPAATSKSNEIPKGSSTKNTLTKVDKKASQCKSAVAPQPVFDPSCISLSESCTSPSTILITTLPPSKATAADLFNDPLFKCDNSTASQPQTLIISPNTKSESPHKENFSQSSANTSYTYLHPKSSGKPLKSPDGVAISPNNDEFDSLVQSVNDTIKSFNSSSEFYDDEEQVLSPTKCNKKKSVNQFNSKKMLSLMIKTEDEKLEESIGGLTKLKEDLTKQKNSDISSNRFLNESKEKFINSLPEDSQTVKKVENSSNIKTNHNSFKIEEKLELKSSKTDTKSDKTTGEKRKRKKSRKEKKKMKDDKHTKSLRKLDKKSMSRHKNRSKKSRNSQNTVMRDPVFMSQIEDIISQLTKLHISSDYKLVATDACLPPMFRVCFPKTLAKAMTNKSTRTTGQRKPSNSNDNDRSTTHCPLPLKKRQHRNVDEFDPSLTHISPKVEPPSTSRPNKQAVEVVEPESSSLPTKSKSKVSRKKSRSSTDTSIIKPSSIPPAPVGSLSNQTQSQASTAKDAAVGTSCGDNLNGPSVAPPGDKRPNSGEGPAGVPIVPIVARKQSRQPHGGGGGAATVVEQSDGKQAAAAAGGGALGQACSATKLTQLKQHKVQPSSSGGGGGKTVSSGGNGKSVTTSTTSSTTSAVAVQTKPHHLDRVVQTKPLTGPDKQANRPNNTPTANKVNKSSLPPSKSAPTNSYSSSSSVPSNVSTNVTSTLDVCNNNKTSATNPSSSFASNNCSSLDESSDADDEFDSDDEGATSNCVRLNDPVSSKLVKKESFAQTLKTSIDFDKIQMARLPSDKTLKKSVDLKKDANPKLKTEITIKRKKKQPEIKKRISTSLCVEASKNSNKKSDSNKVAIKKKRKRAVNKTGFDKPKKRIKAASSSKTKDQNKNSKTILSNQSSKSNGILKNSSQIEKGKQTSNQHGKKKRPDNTTESSTELDSEPVSNVKCKKSFSKKLPISKTSKKSLVKHEASDSSDYEILQSASSALSQDEDEAIPLSIEDYPVYMVTKPSIKAIKKRKEKLHQIKTNPFVRPIPSKVYHKAALYSDEFNKLYPAGPNTQGSNLHKDSEQNETKTEIDTSLPILPFLFASHETVLSSSSSLEEDDPVSSLDIKENNEKRPKQEEQNNDKNAQIQKLLADDSGFSLNFDIWYQYKFNPLPGPMRSANYRRVRQNTFLDTKPIAKHSHQSCNCPRPKNSAPGCGADCINRLMYQECWPQACPCDSLCSNQRIQRYEWSLGLERFMTARRGWGIRTTEPIKKGEFIMEYIGEIASDRLFAKRMTVRYGNDTHHYSLKIDSGMVIDGYRVANEGRFVNHSCEPNCEMQKWAVNGYYRMCMFALRDIKPNEELFYDYNFDNFNSDSQQTCHCGSSKCRGVIGGKKAIQKAIIENVNATTDVEIFNEKVDNLCQDKSNNKNKNNPNEFFFVKCKTKKTNIPASIYNEAFGKSKNKFSGVNNNVVVSYDPNFLNLFPKLKTLNHSNRKAVKNSDIFLLRNYKKTRRIFSMISQAQKIEKKSTTSNVNPYLKQKLNFRCTSHSNGSSSETDSSDSHRSLCKNYIRDLTLTDDQIILKMIRHASVCTGISICVKSFARDKFSLILKEKGLFGDNSKKESQTGSIKRSHDQFGHLIDYLFTFKPILNQIRAIPFMQFHQFENELISYIQKQLQMMDFSEFGGCSKKAKIRLKNFLTEENTVSSCNEFLLSNEEIKKFGQNIFAHLRGIIKEKRNEIDEISEQSYNTYYSRISSLIKQFNKFENNKLHLNQLNFMKMSAFLARLPEIKLKNIFEPENDEMFDLINIVDEEANRQMEEFNLKKIESSESNKVVKKEDLDVVRCICGITREEGKMIQCERCEIWQHLDCAEQFCPISNEKNFVYLCETCQPRSIPRNIPLPKQHYPNHFDVDKHHPIKYYISYESPVVPGLRIKVGDCVYIYRQSSSSISLKDISTKKKPEQNELVDTKKSFIDSIKNAATAGVKNLNSPLERRQCMIIRVQHLALIESINQPILYGHHYLWPSETYHEPNRMFHPNEVLRSPLCEWAALEEVKGICAVLDPKNFVKGRPKGFQSEDIFVCEYRVDRAAKAFNKIANHGIYQVNTKKFAFEMYETKLSIKRTYSPHDIPKEYTNKKPKKGKKEKSRDIKSANSQISERARQLKTNHLLEIANRLNEFVYYWTLIFEQEQKKFDLHQII